MYDDYCYENDHFCDACVDVREIIERQHADLQAWNDLQS